MHELPERRWQGSGQVSCHYWPIRRWPWHEIYYHAIMSVITPRSSISDNPLTLLAVVSDPELSGWAKGDATSFVPHVFTPEEHIQLRLAVFDADRYVTKRHVTPRHIRIRDVK